MCSCFFLLPAVNLGLLYISRVMTKTRHPFVKILCVCVWKLAAINYPF